MLLCGLAVNVLGQEEKSRLSGFTGSPVAGTRLEIQYDPTGGPLVGKEAITGVAYMYNDYCWEVADVDLSEYKGIWYGNFYVPRNCAFVAFKFIPKDVNDMGVADNNDDKGFMWVTLDQNGQQLPGGRLAWAIFRKPSLGKGVMGYFNQYDISDEAVEMWMYKELEYFPQNMPKMFDCFMAMVKLRSGDQYSDAARRYITQFLSIPGLGEQQYLWARDLYRFELRDTEKADSLEQMILANYPHGAAARFKTFKTIEQMPLDDVKLDSTRKFLADFPISEWRKHPEQGQHAFIYYSTFRVLEEALFAKHDYEGFASWFDQMNFQTLNEVYRWNIFRMFKLKLSPDEVIYPLSTAMIEEMMKKQDDLSFMEDVRYTPGQAREIARRQLDDKLTSHILLLTRMEKYEETLPYFENLSKEGLYSNSDLNEAYIQILEKTGNRSKIFSVLEECVRENVVTPAMLEMLKKVYTEKYGKSEGFEEYVQSLKSMKELEEMKKEVKAGLTNVAVEPFVLESMTGKKVNSKDWKGKIVVLDFWATWCGPCKMAFPGMQMAVDKYAKDKEVEFYFIATQESGDKYKQKIKEYFAKNDFTFNVLYDNYNEKSQSANVVFSRFAKMFNDSGIPRKVILKDGVMRYTSGGYCGSPSKLADEISYVIELLKAEK